MSESNLKPLASYPPLPGIKNISSPKSPPIPKSSREPRIIRTGSQSKIPTKVSSDKSIRQKQIEKQLRYAKPHINENQIQNSFNHSETNPVSAFFGAPFEDSQQTIQKFKSYSREKVIYGRHLGDDLVKGEVGKAFDILSGASGRSMKKSRVDGQDYYLYWKNKAHEYLDTNMKYMQDIRKLTRQNDQLKEKIGKIQKTNKVKKQQPKVISDEQTNQELRKISLHYLKKIDDMEKELKKKQISIHSYQIKLTDLSSRLAGDNERIKLMKKMKDELQRLQSANSQKRYEQPTNYNTLKLATSNSLTSTIMSPKTFTPSITTPNGFRSYSRKGMQF